MVMTECPDIFQRLPDPGRRFRVNECYRFDGFRSLKQVGDLVQGNRLPPRYLNGDNGGMATANEDNALTLGGTYLVAQNFQLQLNHTFYDGNKYDGTPANGDQKTILMLFAAF